MKCATLVSQTHIERIETTFSFNGRRHELTTRFHCGEGHFTSKSQTDGTQQTRNRRKVSIKFKKGIKPNERYDHYCFEYSFEKKEEKTVLSFAIQWKRPWIYSNLVHLPIHITTRRLQFTCQESCVWCVGICKTDIQISNEANKKFRCPRVFPSQLYFRHWEIYSKLTGKIEINRQILGNVEYCFVRSSPDSFPNFRFFRKTLAVFESVNERSVAMNVVVVLAIDSCGNVCVVLLCAICHTYARIPMQNECMTHLLYQWNRKGRTERNEKRRKKI